MFRFFWDTLYYKFNRQIRFDISPYCQKVKIFIILYDSLIFGSVGCENSKYTFMMHVQGKVQSPEPKHCNLFSCRTNMQAERRKCVYRTIPRHMYTTLRECLRILGENVVILVILC